MIILKVYLAFVLADIGFTVGVMVLSIIEYYIFGTTNILRGFLEMTIAIYSVIYRDGSMDDIIEELKNFHDML